MPSTERILVVDDEAMVLESVRMTLAHFGFHVETARSGQEALDKLKDGQFALLITDLKMPMMNGDKLATLVKAQHPALPVVLLTGYPPEGRPSGVDLILLKPFSTTDLRSSVDHLLQKRKQAN